MNRGADRCLSIEGLGPVGMLPLACALACTKRKVPDIVDTGEIGIIRGRGHTVIRIEAREHDLDRIGAELQRDIDGLGKARKPYLTLIREIIPWVFSVEYDFEDTDEYKEKVRDQTYTPAEANRIFWRETLFRAHIVVSASLYRTCRLIDASVRENRAANLPGWASCTRALLEAAGDSSEPLRVIPGTLAEHHGWIRTCLSSQERQLSVNAELEDMMIHFTHARRLSGSEKQTAPPSHKAKRTHKYISDLAAYGIPDAPMLYRELCEISHPASDSVSYIFSPIEKESAFRVDPRRDRHAIDTLLARYRHVFNDVLMVSFNSILISLRVFHAFRVFPNVTPLRNVNFSTIPAWADIEAALNRR